MNEDYLTRASLLRSHNAFLLFDQNKEVVVM